MSSTCAVLLLLGLAIVSAVKLEIPKIQKLKQQSEVLSAQNPINSPLCFEYYRPKLDTISFKYEVEYNNCNSQYTTETALEDAKWQAPRQQLVSMGENACNVMTDCSTIVGYVEAFECFAGAGADQSKTMYTISATATEMSVETMEYYQRIETRKTICIINAERSYVEDTSSTYEALNDCLSGKSPITTTPQWITTRGTTSDWYSTTA